MDGVRDLNECESGWLLVENDMSTRLTRPEQLRYALQCMGRNPSDKAVERYWSQCGGSMSYEQFCLVMQREKRTTMSDLMNSFRKIDINGDGYITAKELHRVLTKRGERMTHDEVQAIIDEADKNGDGKLDYAEFCHMLLNTSEQCVQASKLKAQTMVHVPPRVPSSKVPRERSRESKHRSSTHRGGRGGYERRERRREEIRSQLYPAEDQRRRETHVSYGRQLQSGSVGPEARHGNGRAVFSVEDHVHVEESQIGFLHDPMSDKVPYQASYAEKPSPLMSAPSQDQVLIQPASAITNLVQPAEPVSSTSLSTSAAAKAAYGDVKAPPTLSERNHEVKPVEVSGLPMDSSQKATPKPHPQTPANGQIHMDTPATVPSKADINSAAGSLSSIAPSSSEQAITDPFAIPSTSLTKLPPLKKTSLPPLLPPIGGKAAAMVVEDKKKTEERSEQQEDNKGEGNVHVHVAKASPSLNEERTVMEDSTAEKNDGEGDKSGSGENEAPGPSHKEPDTPEAGGEGDSPAHLSAQTGEETNSGGVVGKDEGEREKGSVSPTAAKKEEVVVTGSSEEDAKQKRRKLDQADKSEALDKDDTEERGLKTGRVEGGQTDHLVSGGGGEEVTKANGEAKDGGGRQEKAAAAAVSAPTSVVTPPPKQPKNLKAWNNITGKGCFYLEVDGEGAGQSTEEGGVIRCHQYRLSLPSPTNVWIEMGVAEPGLQATDVLLFVFHTDKDDEPTELVTYTQHKVGQCWISRLDLDAGTYALIPFTSGCHLKPREEPVEEETPLIRTGEGGKISLTEACQEALKEVFHRIDLDGNGYISRMEFDFFQERTSGESCDDDAWKVIQDNFELIGDDEITLKGFLDLHVMTAEDEEGGEAEIWEILDAMGYNKQLQLDQACPFTLEVFTEDCEGEIEIVDLLPFNPIVDPALCRLVVERGVCGDVMDGNGELFKHSFITPHLTTIVMENKGSKKASMQLDCSRSTNFVHSRDSSVCVLPLQPNSTAIGIHLLPENMDNGYTVDCIASKILC